MTCQSTEANARSRFKRLRSRVSRLTAAAESGGLLLTDGSGRQDHAPIRARKFLCSRAAPSTRLTLDPTTDSQGVTPMFARHCSVAHSHLDKRSKAHEVITLKSLAHGSANRKETELGIKGGNSGREAEKKPIGKDRIERIRNWRDGPRIHTAALSGGHQLNSAGPSSAYTQ